MTNRDFTLLILVTLFAGLAVPLLFKPIKINSSLYVDSGLTNIFPVEPLQICFAKIIGVNESCHNEKPKINGLI